MAVLLVLTLAFQGQPSDSLESPLLPALEAFNAGRTDEAIDHLTTLIEDASRKPTERADAYAFRGNLRLAQSQPDRAVDDFSAALEIDPDNASALFGRASAYVVLGESELARADRLRAARVVDGLFGWKRWLFGFFAPVWLLDEYALRSLVVIVPLTVLWAVLSAINFLVGWRQRREGRGSLARLTWVAAAVALLQLTPLLVFLANGVARDRLEGGHAVAIAWCLGIFWLALRLRPPVRRRGDRRPLPEVDDAQVLDRVATLSAAMGVSPPVTRLLHSPGGSLLAMAWVGGLPAPSLVVTDGLLQRLAPDERDAAIAHELAHIANRSLWWLALPVPVAAVAAVVASTIAPTGVSLAFGLAWFVGLSRVVSRLIELDCDHRAARAAGFRAMAGAMQKIHAVHPVRNTGWISLLLYATATHPPRDRRIRALYEAAPPDDRPDAAPGALSLRRQRIAERTALIVWLVSLPLALAIATWAQPVLAVAMLLAVACTPYVLMLLGSWRHSVVSLRRLGYGPIRIVLRVCLFVGIAALLLLVVFSGISTVSEDTIWTMVLPLALILFGATAALARRKQKLQVEVVQALQDRDFTRARALAEAKPKRLAKDHLLRYNWAVAIGLGGDRARAVDELERLRGEKPKFKYAHLALAAFYLDEDRPEAASHVAEQAAAELKADTDLLVFAAIAQEQLGRLDQAEATVARILAIDPENGEALAVSAAVALERGELAMARRRIDEALERAPGGPVVLLVGARIALAGDDPLAAARAVDDLLAAARANPFALLDRRAAALAERLDRPVAAEG